MSVAEGGFPEDGFDWIAPLEPGNYWFESRNRLIIWAMHRYFPEAATFLEVGCGTGFVLLGLHVALPQLRLTGLDASGTGLDIARSRVPSASFLQRDARDLDARDAFDVVGAFDVLEHIPDDTGVLAHLYRAVRPGGGVLVAVPQHRWLWSRVDELGHHVRRYRRRELVSRMQAAGFEIVRATSFVALLLPVMAVSRWIDARRTAPFDCGEFHVSPAINGALTGVLAVERGLIRHGVSWPAGGSLLVVGRKPHAGRR